MILSLDEFITKKNNLKANTMNESDLSSVRNFAIYPGDSKITTDKGT